MLGLQWEGAAHVEVDRLAGELRFDPLRGLRQNGGVVPEELDGARKVLSAAALTYVAALLTSIAQLLRLIMIFGGRRRND